MIDEELREEIVSELRSDWLAFDDVAFLLREVSGDRTDLLRRTLDVTDELIQDGTITPGALVKHGFEPWTGPRIELAQRVRTEAQQFPDIRSMLIGEVCWFDLTEEFPA